MPYFEKGFKQLPSFCTKLKSYIEDEQGAGNSYSSLIADIMKVDSTTNRTVSLLILQIQKDEAKHLETLKKINELFC